MNIFTYEVYIFLLSDIINTNQKIDSIIENNKQKIEFILSWYNFCNLLLKYGKKVYIINNYKIYEKNNIWDNFTNLINNNNNLFFFPVYPINMSNLIYYYIIILKKNYKKFELYNFISFHSCYKQLQNIEKIIYNCVLVEKENNKNVCSYTNNYSNKIKSYQNIHLFEYKNNFEYLPFYISSKTIHRNKWIELRKYFPIIASWIENDKDKYSLSKINKINICDSINNDIHKSFFGIFYCEENEKNHIGSLIEIGLLLAQSKKIYVCGNNIYNDEVLFQFKSFIDFSYVNNSSIEEDYIREGGEESKYIIIPTQYHEEEDNLKFFGDICKMKKSPKVYNIKYSLNSYIELNPEIKKLYKIFKKIQFDISLHYMTYIENIKQFEI